MVRRDDDDDGGGAGGDGDGDARSMQQRLGRMEGWMQVDGEWMEARPLSDRCPEATEATQNQADVKFGVIDRAY